MSFCVSDEFPFFKKIGFLGILGPPYCGIGATIRIGREMLCVPYAGFFANIVGKLMAPTLQKTLTFNHDIINLGRISWTKYSPVS